MVEKQILDLLLGIKGARWADGDKLLLLGALLVLRKLDIQRKEEYLRSLECSGDRTARFMELWEAVWCRYVSQGKERPSWQQLQLMMSEPLAADLLVCVCQLPEARLLACFQAIVPQMKFQEETALPADILRLGRELLGSSRDDGGYIGLSGMAGLALELPETCCIESQELAWQLLCIQEILQRGRGTAVYRNPLIDPVIANGAIVQFDWCFLNGVLPDINWAELFPQIAMDKYGQYPYGMAQARSTSLFSLSHALRILKPEGRGIVLVEDGALFRAGKDGAVRRSILAEDVIEAVIALPDGVLGGRAFSLSVNLVLLNKRKPKVLSKKILFVNARGNDTMRAGRERNFSMTAAIGEKIFDVCRTKKNTPEFSRLLQMPEGETNLLPGNYVYHQAVEMEGIGEVRFDWSLWPEGLAAMPLSEVADVYRGINIVGEVTEDPQGPFSIINIADVQDGELRVDTVKRYRIGMQTNKDYAVRQNDILITSRGTVTKLCRVPSVPNDGFLLSQNFYAIRFKDTILIENAQRNAELLKLYLESPLGAYLLENMKSGSVLPVINRKLLLQLPIPRTLWKHAEAAMQVFDSGQARIAVLRRQLAAEIYEAKCELWENMGISPYFHLPGQKK